MDTTPEINTSVATEKPKKPNWLRVKLPTGEEYIKVRNIVDKHKLHTICQSGNCPNMGECWGAGTATFMIRVPVAFVLYLPEDPYLPTGMSLCVWQTL